MVSKVSASVIDVGGDQVAKSLSHSIAGISIEVPN